MCFICIQERNTDASGQNHIQTEDVITEGDRFGYSAPSTGFAAADVDWSQYISTISDGLSWDDNGPATLTTISYTYTLISSHSNLRYSSNPRQLNQAEQNAVEGIFDMIESFANVSFIRATLASSADISFYVGDLNLASGAAGIAGFTYSGDQLQSASVGMDDNYADFETSGNFDYSTLLHEIGHALGLKHSGNYGAGDTGPFLPDNLDNEDNTVMTYNPGSNGFAEEYRELDVLALQSLYGSGDGEVPGDPTIPGGAETITGGVKTGTSGNDVYTGATNAVTIYGGGGSDYITGSSAADSLFGGTGVADTTDVADTLAGAAGDDLIFGNAGSDLIYGGTGSASTLDGNDTVYGGLGYDTIYGNDGNDSLAGGGGIAHPQDEADTIYGGAGNDSIVGNGQGDLLDGGSGNDVIYGGLGSDTIFGGTGDDFIAGQFGNDSMTGGTGADVFWFGGIEGTQTIADFVSGEDIIGLFAGGFNGRTTAQQIFDTADFTVFGGNTYISFTSASTVIKLEGLSTSLSINDFAIVDPVSLTDAI